jgi:transposase
VKQAEIDQGKRGGPPTEERDELRRLRREVRTLRQEKEILAKANGFLAVQVRFVPSAIGGLQQAAGER